MLSGQTSVYIDTIKSDTENNALISAVNMDVTTDVTEDVGADAGLDEEDSVTDGKKKKHLDRSKYGKYIMRFGKNLARRVNVKKNSRSIVS